jgi:signal transduction histidine kinase/DNA-binding response OmpR family regulator
MLLLGVSALVTVASWLAARNLHIALDWVWRSYEEARANEQHARDRGAELRQALKALDEASWRIERANEALALARNQAEEARRLKQQFVQTISHELRTPLNIIVGFTELMAQSPEYYGAELAPSYLRDLSVVHRNASHLQRLVNDVLDLARIDAMQMPLSLEETNPTLLITEALATARSLVESAGLELRVEIAPDLPATIWADPTRIRQVLYNLLNNAARFTEHGSVTVSARAEEGCLLFSVSDTGVGVAPHQIPRLFEDFVQVDGGTRRRHGGAGLGLAICRRFVELHHGHIWVESTLGVGSAFTFGLPLDPRRPVLTGASLESTGHLGAIRPQNLPLIIVVTKNTMVASLLSVYVHDCQMMVIPDLAGARQVALTMPPDLVLLDSPLGGAADQSLGELAGEWQLPRTAFITFPLSGGLPSDHVLGADGYLIKPVSREMLWNVLRRFGEAVDTVLIVDDDRDFVSLLTRMLDDPVRRYLTMSASSGQEALHLLDSRKPDLICLDIGLPDMDGLELLKRLRGHPRWCHTPVVLVSGQAGIEGMDIVASSMSLAREDPFSAAEMVSLVEATIRALVRRGTAE